MIRMALGTTPPTSIRARWLRGCLIGTGRLTRPGRRAPVLRHGVGPPPLERDTPLLAQTLTDLMPMVTSFDASLSPPDQPVNRVPRTSRVRALLRTLWHRTLKGYPALVAIRFPKGGIAILLHSSVS